MTAETCIPCSDYRIHLVLADGTAYKPVAECIEAGNEAARSPGPYGPAPEIRAFCWCAEHPCRSACIRQFLALDAKDGGARRRQPHCHQTGATRDEGSGDSEDGGAGDGGGPPELAAYDNALEMRLAAKLAATIAETVYTRPIETISALVAALAYVVTPSLDGWESLTKIVGAVELLLLKNIAIAQRVAARAQCNGRAPP